MTRTMHFRELSRHQRQMMGEGSTGAVAEQLVAQEYGLVDAPASTDWYDVVDRENGTKGEVKSTFLAIGDDHPARGRFRLWKSQLESLIRSDAQATAWVYFVLFDEDAAEAVIQRRRPSTVKKMVEQRGGWNQAGHEDYEYQMKLPIAEIFDR